ncbi:cryptochrome/photolyase family protein [Ornithinimicrobium sediminis]|uniref:cryptochrome/photolyase family protein n=1 Tax=Ornithinimicrobium sediminis TaxID=2904603 RepID=UPI001E392E9E|nr:deoxyribodipyrimidine photo-lyase [Ornithinimicrobium sediminis]MCE0487194.1 DNA photolyase family protein [Ornithinimicrobium sediminis]
MPTTVLWLRRDLRLHDLPALGAAHEAADGGRVLPLFVLDPALLDASPVRTHCLLSALEALQEAYDGALVLRTGRPEEVVPAVAREVGATSVHVSAESTPYGRRRDARVLEALPEGVPLVATGCAYAVGPGTVRNGSGDPYKVFTPFSKAWRAHGWPDPAPVPDGLRWHRQTESEDLPGRPEVDPGVHLPQVGEEAALHRWEEFLDAGVTAYGEERDRPDHDGTSRLSVQLKYGTVHPRTLLADLAGRREQGVHTFVTELAWREFYADVLWHHPRSAWADLRPALAGLAYDDPEDDETVAAAVQAWREGRTGYPFVDAGMRQLLSEGWMHNRVRMVTASFLVKHLHVWWPVGARHFLQHLADGDVASNNHGWQWVAGTGTDAAPYFRVFNPVTQGQRFDPDGDYVRRYVPELRHLAGKTVHEPWAALDGYTEGYPEPVVEHKEAREEALRRYEQARA